MLFKVCEQEELRRLFDTLAADNAVVGPVQSGIDRNGNALYAFEPVTDFKTLKLGYTTTKQPPKPYFLPFRETLASFRIDGNDWHKTVDYHCDRPSVSLRPPCLRYQRPEQARQGADGQAPIPCPTMRRSGRTCSSSASTAIPSPSASAVPWAPTPCSTASTCSSPTSATGTSSRSCRPTAYEHHSTASKHAPPKRSDHLQYMS